VNDAPVWPTPWRETAMPGHELAQPVAADGIAQTLNLAEREEKVSGTEKRLSCINVPEIGSRRLIRA